MLPETFVLASQNRHKLAEFTALLAPHGIAVLPAPKGYHCAETASTFAGNAELKARAVAQTLATGDLPPAWVLADDSGLEVPALGGAPGIFSARYAPPVPPGGDQDGANRQKLQAALCALAPEQRQGAFVCALVALPPQNLALPPILAEGRLAGLLRTEDAGHQGFGYDALFVPQDLTGLTEHAGGAAPPAHPGRTLAELGPTVKDAISHRARALRALLARLGGSEPAP